MKILTIFGAAAILAVMMIGCDMTQVISPANMQNAVNKCEVNGGTINVHVDTYMLVAYCVNGAVFELKKKQD
jgi:hypothetical protein